MGQWLRAGVGSLWWILMSGVVLVLLIGCANLANLLLSRGTNRRAEFAVRKALGAGEGRLVRQALTESVVLAVGGGALGILVGALLLDLLLAWMPGGVPRAESVGIDPGILVFTLGVSVAAGLLFGTLPALRARRDVIGPRLRRGGRTDRASRALVAAEVAMAVILLAAAGLMARSFLALKAENPGIATRDRLVFPVSLPDERPAEARQAFFRDLEARLETLPGVASAGVVSTLPVVDFTPGAWVNEPGATHEGSDRPGAKYQVVSPGYFETAGLELLRGRLLTRDDGVGGTPSVLVSQAAAEELFPGEDPIGKRFDLGLEGDIAPLSTVVGMVGDVKLNGLDEPAPGAVYAVQELIPWWRGYQVVLRLEPGAPAPAGVRDVVRGLDPDVPWLGVRRLDEVFVQALGGRRDTMLLFGLLGLVALVMAAVGVFGVLAYLVGRRTREIGIRIAIGADPGSVRAGVLRQGMVPVGGGILVGLVATAGLGRFLQSLVFGVEPLDAPTLLGVTVLLAGVAAAAIYVPALRASRVDPVRALEVE
jgi:putative ABC transport system permease protein